MKTPSYISHSARRQSPKAAIELTRRDFLRFSSQLTATLALGSLPVLGFSSAKRVNQLNSYPFTLGVASGDPTENSVILWTRIAADALTAEDRTQDLELVVELADTEAFTSVIRKTTAVAPSSLGHSVHIDVAGLEPARDYFYRWIIAGETSPTGRTRTAPARNANVDQIHFGIASCQQYEQGFFTAYEHMAAENLDLIVHLGDYIYESSWGQVLVRAHEGPEIHSLADYRARYNTYKSDPDLQSAHASAPWIVTWDDHEVDNNYAADIAEDEQTPAQLLLRRVAAYQAFYEFMPIRLPAGRNGPDMQIYRQLRFGNLMEMSVLDTRQYRSDQACGDGRQLSCSEHQDASRTLMGAKQKQWLFNQLSASDARWNILAQQIMMARLMRRNDAGDELLLMDIWDGYPGERQQLVDLLASSKIPNPIVLTGDIHSNWVNDIKADFTDPRSKTIATEFVGTSITSGGDGQDSSEIDQALQTDNPHIRFYNNQRGYLTARVTPETWTTDFRVMSKVTEKGAPIKTRASFVVESGKAGAIEA